jgi:hypothetical protein
MDVELKSYLDGMETRLGVQTDTLRAHVDAGLAATEARLRAHVDEAEARCRAHTETVETRLLNEFWKWARTADARYNQHQAVVGGLDIRVRTIEDRLSDLERTRAS